MSLTVAEAALPPDSWRALAREHGRFYHDPRWVTTLAEVYRYPLTCLTALNDGTTVGALALAEVPGIVGRPRLVSLPFSYAAGPVATDPAASGALVDHARRLAAERAVKRLEIKQRNPLSPEPVAGLTRVTHYSTYLVDTSAGESAVWETLHAASTRRGIRKAEKEGVKVTRGSSEADWMDMAVLEEETAHRHGVPAPPRDFFLAACRSLQPADLASVYLARVGDRLAAGIVVYKGPREWIYAYGASRPELLSTRPNHLLLWTAIRDAIAARAAFDLGRAAPEQDGLVEFKRRWGGQPIPLAYDYWPAAGGLNVADRSRGPLALAARLWSRLPSRVTRAGAALYRYLG